MFGVFAVITLVQFSKISDEKIYQARLDTYRSDVRAYDAAVKANTDCIATIATREVYRGIIAGISALFQRSADLPVELFPDSAEAAEYQRSLTEGIQALILTPVEEGLQPKKESDCPQIPKLEPVKPER